MHRNGRVGRRVAGSLGTSYFEVGTYAGCGVEAGVGQRSALVEVRPRARDGSFARPTRRTTRDAARRGWSHSFTRKVTRKRIETTHPVVHPYVLVVPVKRGKGCLPDRPAGHTVHSIQHTGSAPTSAPPNGSRRPVTVYTGHRHRTGTI